MENEKKSKSLFAKVIIGLLIASTCINIIQATRNTRVKKINEPKSYYVLKEKADQLLIDEQFEEAFEAYTQIEKSFPNKIDIEKALTTVHQKDSISKRCISLEQEIDNYELLVQKFKKENQMTQSQYNELMNDFDLDKENESVLQDSIYLVKQRLEKQMAQLQQDLIDSKRDILDLKTPEGLDIKYIGQVKSGKANGFGFAIFARKGFYEGDWKNNLRHGQGTYFWQNGDKYQGTFNNGKREGQGVYEFISGDKYDGEWKNNLRHGRGKFYNKKGKLVYDGLWEEDETVE